MSKQLPVCTDDFGNEIYACHYTGDLIAAQEAVSVGATLPGVRAQYFMADTDVAKQARKHSGIWFHESEANCNTCARLVREPSSRRSHTPLCGHCHLRDSFTFWPDDPMHMPCYESRWVMPK